MKQAAVAIAVSVAVSNVACGALPPEKSSARSDDTQDTEPSPTVPTPPTHPAAASCARGTPPHPLLVWQRSFGEGDVAQATSVATDLAGSTFVALAAGGTFKVNDIGEVIWSKPFGSVVATGATGDLVVAGNFSGSMTIGEEPLTATGQRDVYVAKLDPSGAVIYAVSLVSLADVPEETSDARVEGLALDEDGTAIVSGPGVGTIKLDSAGALAWRKPFHGAVAIDATHDVALTGGLVGSASFGGKVLVSAGGEDVFVARLDAAGNHLFSQRFGDGSVIQHGEAIAIDASGALLISGIADGSVDFGGGPLTIRPGSCPAEARCERAGFVLKLDASGRHVFSRSLAPVRSMPGIAADSRGHVFASGSYTGDAPPYRLLLLREFTPDGTDVPIAPRLATELGDSGAGHHLAIDRCDDVLWSMSASPATGAGELALLTKLSPL